MKIIIFTLCILLFPFNSGNAEDIPDCYNHVDQVLWVVSDVENTVANYEELGFSQFRDFGVVEVISGTTGDTEKIRLVCANLAGAHVNWIKPLDKNSIFQDFHSGYGDGAMSLVHRFDTEKEMQKEIERLADLDIKLLEKKTIKTVEGDLIFFLMDTNDKGKYYLGFTYGDSGLKIHQSLSAGNRNNMKLNQYAFAIRDPGPVSAFWHKIGLPEFQINHPELGDTRYYGELVDHELIQGWQRHGSIAYEWCIPVKPPIVYEDHIQKHGEGIHHLAFTVDDMDEVLEDYTSRGFVVSMGGTWGEDGKPGSGRYEYIDLEKAGGVTMELLWSYHEDTTVP